MAAARVTDVHEHQGTAAERVAMFTTTLPPGSTFYETDTLIQYIWGGTSWSAM